MAGAAKRRRAEGHVQLLDPEAVRRRDGAQRARRLGQELGPHPLSGEAGDCVLAAHWITGSSVKTWLRVTALPVSARVLKRTKADSSASGPSSIPASAHARANAWRPECLP